jgi:8-oxo-dGTP diphosphatase
MVFNEILARRWLHPVSSLPVTQMGLPYKIATLLYCFDEQDRVLLMERTREPNKGLWSPCGGKLDMETGESPYACACREAAEEIGLRLTPSDLHLFGIVSEHGYLGEAHWLMFLFEVKPRLGTLPPPHDEGRFGFFARNELDGLKMPSTDVEQIWPLVWEYRHGFFAAHCKTVQGGANEWLIEETRASS